MKKLVKEELNEGYQEDFHRWLENSDIWIKSSTEKELIYALAKKVYDLEKELIKRTPIKGTNY